MTHLSRRLQVILWLTGIAVVTTLGAEFFLSTSPNRPFGHTQQGHLVGWVGFGMILLACGYPIKRWLYPNQVWSKTWFQIHLVLGVVGPLLILVHSGVHFHALVPVLALIMMALVVLSGIAGQALHHLAFKTLYDQRHELAYQGLSEERIEALLFDLTREEKVLRWWRCVHVPLTWTFFSLTLMHIVGALYWGGTVIWAVSGPGSDISFTR